MDAAGLKWVVTVLAAVVAAVISQIVRRLFSGPLVPTWSWGVELRVIGLRALFQTGAMDRRARKSAEALIDPPRPRAVRGLGERVPAVVGDRPGEWIVRRGTELADAATVLYFHGGGYFGGTPGTHRHFTSRFAWETHTRLFSLDYRLGPEHKFPAALDDAYAAYFDLLAAGTYPAEIILAGDSAGGGLALALLLRLRDEGQDLPAGAVMFSPYTDLAHTGASIRRNARTDYLAIAEDLDRIPPNLLYLGDADPRHPWASPLYGDFGRLPPLLIFAGGREMILDDSTRVAEKAVEAGVDVTLHIEEDMVHVWPVVFPEHPASKQALAIAEEFIARL
jgi:acetyl esterase/lipase